MRFGAALVAFALASAMVSRGPLLAEFLVQLRDPNMIGGAVFGGLLHAFGWAIVVAICALLAGCAILLSAWRARTRGAGDWHATLVAALVALCMSGRAGVSLDPIGWLAAAAVCMLLERDDDRSAIGLIVVVAAWSLLQGGATLGTLLIVCAVIGKLTDDGSYDKDYLRRLKFYGIAAFAGILQLHDWPWHAYGAHALYLDALRAGAQRDRLWNGNISAPVLGFCGVLVVAACYGLRRRGRMTDSIMFFTLFVLTLIDARMLPYFGIVGAPIAVDALAAFYILARSFPRGSVLRYTPATLAACAVFIAGMALSEPKVTTLPQAYEQPARLISYLQGQHAPHRVLCTKPRWCDGLAQIVPNARAVADDRAGITPFYALRVESAVSNSAAGWHDLLVKDRVDTVIASEDDTLVALLELRGWHVRAADGTRVILQ